VGAHRRAVSTIRGGRADRRLVHGRDLNATTPLWTVVLACPCGTQKSVTTWQAAGLIVGFGGALLISRLGAHRPAWHLLAAWNAWPHQ
jgi:drug/metabolite transporter (DMT)-like permease